MRIPARGKKKYSQWHAVSFELRKITSNAMYLASVAAKRHTFTDKHKQAGRQTVRRNRKYKKVIAATNSKKQTNERSSTAFAFEISKCIQTQCTMHYDLVVVPRHISFFHLFDSLLDCLVALMHVTFCMRQQQTHRNLSQYFVILWGFFSHHFFLFRSPWTDIRVASPPLSPLFLCVCRLHLGLNSHQFSQCWQKLLCIWNGFIM